MALVSGLFLYRIFRFMCKSQIRKLIFMEFAVSVSRFLLKSRITGSDH